MADDKCTQRRRGKGGIDLDHSLLNAGRPKRQRRAMRDFREEEDETSFKWNVTEKEKLLEALYRHSHYAYESISNVVKTKTPKQVEQFIEKIMNTPCLKLDQRYVELDPEKGAAPLERGSQTADHLILGCPVCKLEGGYETIHKCGELFKFESLKDAKWSELWLSLVQELIKTDKKIDHSKHYTKIMNVIGKNEPMPKSSGFEGLDWRNLYQYISDLLADKAVLQPLSSMESLVMLDMMHSMGDTLHTSDMHKQRRLLDLKYQLYKFEAQHRGHKEFAACRKAIQNDFTDVEFDVLNPDEPCTSSRETIGDGFAVILSPSQPPSSAASTSASSPQAQPATSSQIRPDSSTSSTTLTNPLELIKLTKSQSSISSTSLLLLPTPVVDGDHDSNSNNASSTFATASISEATERSSTVSPGPIPSTSGSDPSCSNTSTFVASPQPNTNDISTTNSQTDVFTSTSVASPQPNTNDISTTNSQTDVFTILPPLASSFHIKDKSEKVGDDSHNVDDDDEAEEEEEGEEEVGDPLPKLFSLNPLTIPPHILDIHSKSSIE